MRDCQRIRRSVIVQRPYSCIYNGLLFLRMHDMNFTSLFVNKAQGITDEHALYIFYMSNMCKVLSS